MYSECYEGRKKNQAHTPVFWHTKAFGSLTKSSSESKKASWQLNSRFLSITCLLDKSSLNILSDRKCVQTAPIMENADQRPVLSFVLCSVGGSMRQIHRNINYDFKNDTLVRGRSRNFKTQGYSSVRSDLDLSNSQSSLFYWDRKHEYRII